MEEAIKRFFKKHLVTSQPPNKIAKALSLGVFMAFSPFIGVQIPLIFLISWLFGLSSVLIISVAYALNNPFITMVPIMIVEYYFGVFLMEHILHSNLHKYDPSWISWINAHLTTYIGAYMGEIKICLWYYIVGSLIIATLAGIITYLFANRMVKRLSL